MLMSESIRSILIGLLLGAAISAILFSCKKDDNPVKFTDGTFPDTLINLGGLNSTYDDYNADPYSLYGSTALVFSSNRKSSGSQFDIEQGIITYDFDLTTGSFVLRSELTNDSFTAKLIGQAITPDDDFGPYRIFSTADGFEYFFLSSVNEDGNLDLFYLKNSPVYGSKLPEITGPKPVTLLNTSSDDAYLSFDSNMDSAYFTSSRNGNFDIFLSKMPTDNSLSDMFDGHFINSSQPDSINSTEDDKCPFIHRGVMVFASNRLGGLGGYDVYYSVFKNGKWNSPVNFGPEINTSSDEYRPVLASVQDYTNSFMIFSSDRPGGKGGFDLYFTGLELPD